MEIKFGRDYYYGGRISNYYDYEVADDPRHWRYLINIVEGFVSGGRVLDLGCAFGYFLKYLPDPFSEKYGIDVSRFAINKAKKVLPKGKFFVRDVHKLLPFSDRFFDLITAFNLIEHVNRRIVFSRVNRVLKEGGFFIFRLPYDSWANRILKLFDKDITHKGNFPPVRRLKEQAKRHGFRIRLVKKDDRLYLFRRLLGLRGQKRIIPRGITFVLEKAS